jgi:hypothetical protein
MAASHSSSSLAYLACSVDPLVHEIPTIGATSSGGRGFRSSFPRRAEAAIDVSCDVDRRFLRNVAYHESGHTAAYRLLGMPVARVTIEPVVIDGFACEGLTWRTLEPADGPSFDDLAGTLREMKPPLFDDRANIAGELLALHHRVIATLAGPIAEALFTVGPMLPNVDADNARALAEVIVRSPAAVDAYLAYCAAEARGLLIGHRDAVVALAEALIQRRTLCGAKIDEVLRRSLDGPSWGAVSTQRKPWEISVGAPLPGRRAAFWPP